MATLSLPSAQGGHAHPRICPICGINEHEHSHEEEDKENFLNSVRQLAKALREDNKLRVGTGRMIPANFKPPRPVVVRTQRFVSPRPHDFIRHIEHHTQFLIYTHGACLDNGRAGFAIYSIMMCLSNGQSRPRAGCAFVFRSCSNTKCHVSFPLELEGPIGQECAQTSNRAELRAVLAALRCRWWYLEGSEMVIATDSKYVVNGITRWMQNGWTTRIWAPVANQDLWLYILGEIERADRGRMRVTLWRIPREWNAVADHYAKQAASEGGRGAFKDTIDMDV
ncbi:hypothetical protein N7517_000966 [Penicillium concentricum]|uniref:ribonuclease H n=1 Tax=Penicillium concentricum TaxID=293559 RepID=A0A9W9SS08_9EURO|nr:uncharacterized protein N7517_000966 [Penicillium concentricum]KAJ5383055.1 hypothetical protein N7517_000966 [Penicillium concentricum]